MPKTQPPDQWKTPASILHILGTQGCTKRRCERREGWFSTMTLLQPMTGDAVARHIVPEDFRTFAAIELSCATPWQIGTCFRPECSAPFVPARSWQIYCCTACERAGTAEMRKWGHRLALSALVWRLGKYEPHDAALRKLNNAARRHVGHVQSLWLADRNARSCERVSK